MKGIKSDDKYVTKTPKLMKGIKSDDKYVTKTPKFIKMLRKNSSGDSPGRLFKKKINNP